MKPWQQLGATFTTVHELTHVFTIKPDAGVYGHREMARAASTAEAALGLNVREKLNLKFPGRRNFTSNDQFDIALSEYFDRTLAYACRKVKLLAWDNSAAFDLR